MEWLGEDQVRNALLQGKGTTKQEFFTLSHCLHQIFQGAVLGKSRFHQVNPLDSLGLGFLLALRKLAAGIRYFLIVKSWALDTNLFDAGEFTDDCAPMQTVTR